MAGKKGRSGGRRPGAGRKPAAPERLRGIAAFDHTSAESIGAFTEAVAAGVIAGRINNAQSKALKEIAVAALRAITVKENLGELEEYRAMERRAQEAENQRKANEQDDRFKQGGRGSGRVPLDVKNAPQREGGTEGVDPPPVRRS